MNNLCCTYRTLFSGSGSSMVYPTANVPGLLSLRRIKKVPGSWFTNAALTPSLDMNPYKSLKVKFESMDPYPDCHMEHRWRWYLSFCSAFPNQPQNSSKTFALITCCELKNLVFKYINSALVRYLCGLIGSWRVPCKKNRCSLLAKKGHVA